MPVFLHPTLLSPLPDITKTRKTKQQRRQSRQSRQSTTIDNINRQHQRAQKGGKTKQKIARVAGARLEVKEHEKVVEIRGGARECARAREYVATKII